MKDNLHKNILENVPIGYAYHKIILDGSGKPVDYVFLDVNKEFEKLTGLKKSKILNRKVTEVLPNINKNFDWVAIYSEVALTGKQKEFEQYSEPLNKYYHVKVYSPEKYHFVTLFKDISTEIQMLKSSQHFLEHDDGPVNYHNITEKLLSISGARLIAFNQFEDNGKDFRTMAVSGINKHLDKGLKILGFDPRGKKWDHDPVRAQKIEGKSTIYFDTLQDLTGHVIPSSIVTQLEKIFKLGQTIIVKITRNGKMLGDFTIIMPKGKELKKTKLIETYAQQVGLYLARKKAEDQLYEREELYRAITERSHDGIYIRRRTKFLFLNKRAAEIMGYTKQEMYNLSVCDVIHPDDMKKMLKIDDKRKEGKEFSSRFKVRGITKVGDRVYLEFSVSTIPYNGKTAELGSVRDITKYKIAEKLLKEKETKYRSIFEQFQDLYYKIDSQGIIREVSPSLTQITGYTRADVINKPVVNMYANPEDRQKLLKKIMKDKKVKDYEIRLKRKDGKIRYGAINARLLITNDGTIKGIEGSLRDITHRIETKHKLRDKTKLLKGMLDGITNAILFQKPDHTIIRVNSAAQKLLNKTHEEIKGRKCYDIIGRSIECEDCPSSRAIENKQSQRAEKYFPELDKYIMATSNPILDENGEVAYIIEQLQDITERKKAEQALKESEKKYRLMVESSMVGIVIIYNNRFKYVNNAFANMLDMDNEDLVSRNINEIFPEDSVDKFGDFERNHVSDTNDKFTFDTTFKTSGKKKYVKVTPTTIHYKGQIAIFATIQDITEQKEIMETLKRSDQQTEGLNNLISICASCNKIKDEDKDKQPWIRPADYITERLPDIQFSHGMCPECLKKWYPNYKDNKSEKD